MSVFLSIDPRTREAQHKASAPRDSAWVMANAGSGKTHVLTQRVVRLLLEGVPPSRILCLTFTKAAAANMAQRVFDTLRKWTTLDDAALAQAIVQTGARHPDAMAMGQARRLFARTIETPGGLKIQTIHAFCERLLHLFPFEANVPADFEVADTLSEAAMQREALADIIRDADEAGAVAQALHRLALETDPRGQDNLFREMVSRRTSLRRMFAESGSPENCARLVAQAHDLAPADTEEACVRALLEDGIARESWPRLAARLREGGANDAKLGVTLQAAFDARTQESRLELYRSLFYTTKGELRGTGKNAFIGKVLQAKHPDLLGLLETERDRVDLAARRLAAARLVARTQAMLIVAQALIAAYEARKSARGMLDYEDMIERTRALLTRERASAWVLFKLDRGIDHILVDEAQDTSPAQWDILRALSEEFLAGSGASHGWRTFFAVGDEKQSIFSFQGAAPEKFEEMRRAFARRLKEAGRSFADEKLQLSFRSTETILKAVDDVFAVPAHFEGLQSGGDNIRTVHASARPGLPGHVEIWPVLADIKADPPPGWLPPDAPDTASDSGAARLARRVAQRIAMMLREDSRDRVFDGKTRRRRAVRADDILILVRRRNAFFEAVIRALKREGVPVAGADRLKLTDHIAVSDLIAAGRAALLPEDDLTVAAVLKSPFFGLDDDDLLTLAPGRKGALFRALEASPEARHQKAAERLAQWRALARKSTAFGFYAHLLGAEGGRRALLARLGGEAGDAIDEFLSFALDFDTREEGALGLFLSSVEMAGIEIKRDLEGAEGAVRVMTVHAAKGLEAKIVFLPDTCAAGGSRHDPKLLSLRLPGMGEESPGLAFWPPGRAADDTKLAAQARQEARTRAAEEYRRLLYVAMTRAEEQLYIGGYIGIRNPDAGCWYEMIGAALKDGMQMQPAFWDEAETIWRTPAVDWEDEPPQARAAALAVMDAPPAWLAAPAPVEAQARRRLRPSRDAGAGRGSGPVAEAAAFGDLAHGAIEFLAGVAEQDRPARLAAFLAARGGALGPTQREAAGRQAMGVLADPRLAPLFAPGSMAEVALSAHVTLPSGEIVEVPGRIDRLAVADGAILIADFKTGAPDEGRIAGHVQQLALYRAALRQVPAFAEKSVTALLVFTAGPDIRHFDAAALDAAFAGIKA